MADLAMIPVEDKIKDATYSCYDGACGTGGMLTVAQNRLLKTAEKLGKKVSIHLFGQEVNPETYAICKADMLLKGDGEEARHIFSARLFPMMGIQAVSLISCFLIRLMGKAGRPMQLK